MSWLGVLGGVAAFFGLIGLVAGAFAVLRANAATATIEVYKAELDAYKSRVTTLEDQDQRCQATLLKQQEEIAVLRTFITAAPAISELKSYIDGRFDEMIALLGHPK